MIQYLDIVDFLMIAEAVTGIDADVIAKFERLSLADSALYAPQAGYGDEEFYERFERKAAVLLEHLLLNHPLPDGNKRTAWVCMREFIARNGYGWNSASVDESEELVLGVVTKSVSQDELADWILHHLISPK